MDRADNQDNYEMHPDLLMSGLSESVRRTGDTLFEARMLIVFSTWEVGIRIRRTHCSHTQYSCGRNLAGTTAIYQKSR